MMGVALGVRGVAMRSGKGVEEKLAVGAAVVVDGVAAVAIDQTEVEVERVVGLGRALDWVLLEDPLDHFHRRGDNRWLCLDGADSLARLGTTQLEYFDRRLRLLRVGEEEEERK